MSAITNLIISDGTANRTYVPFSITGETSTWVDTTTSSMVAGQSQITFTFSPASSKRPTDKATIALSLPKIVSVAGVLKVDSIGRYVNGTYIIPPSWEANDRTILVNLVSSLVSAGSFTSAAVIDRAPPF